MWAFRFEYNLVMLGNLMALLRLEGGATEQWRKFASATGIETAISAGRLAQLNTCIPGTDDASLVQALRNTVQLGRELCANIAAKHGLAWPEQLAERVEQVLSE
jgi:hypothetical protein